MPGTACSLEGDEAVHLARVLRLRPGDEVELFDGRGGVGRFRLAEVGRRRSRLELLSRRGAAPALPFAVHCAVATPKGKRAHRLVEALTELGAASYAPLVCARSAARPPEPETALRWAQEACKQCGRDLLPAIAPPLAAENVPARVREHPLSLLLDPRGAVPLREALPATPCSTLLLVGPEGGFTDAERETFAAAGARSVVLGPSVLRIETAAAAALAALVAAWA